MSPSLRQYRRCRIRDNDSNFELDKLNRNLGVAVAAVLRPAILDRNSATLDPTEFAQSLHKSGSPQSVGRRCARPQEPDGRHLCRLLRARRERPCHCAAAENVDELAPTHGCASYSITVSARRWNDCGNSIPSAFAALRLIANSNFVGCSTGRSAGFSPLRMRPT